MFSLELDMLVLSSASLLLVPKVLVVSIDIFIIACIAESKINGVDGKQKIVVLAQPASRCFQRRSEQKGEKSD